MTTSRLTFRNKAGAVCWQKQLRDKHNDEGVPPVPHLDVGRAIVRPVTRQLAEQVILKYEWLGTLPFGCGKFYGLFFGHFCAGVTCFSIGGGGANVYAHKEFGVQKDELAYLQRGANVHWSPKGANSKLISLSCKLLARETGAKLVIAYSDTDAGEIGTVYQASNWVCIGRGSSTRQWVAPNGRVYDQKKPYNLAKSRGGTRKQWAKALYAAGWYEQISNPKYRYVFVLDKKDKRLTSLIESLKKDYPKRVQSAGG